MTPKTRSGGGPAPSRVYHSTPSLQQVRFPARKRMVTYGKKESGSVVDKRQSTLTQINFVASSFPEDNAGVVELSDSEDDMGDGLQEMDGQDKENVGRATGKRRVLNEEDDDDEEDEEPVASSGRQRRKHGINSKPRQTPKRTYFEDHNDSDQTAQEVEEDPILSGARKRKAPPASAKSNAGTSRSTKNKRRRTMGDELPENIRSAPSKNKSTNKGRRKTLGDTPNSTTSSKYHTQTITQVVRRWDSTIKDSEDEDEDGGFDEWVGAPSPSPAQDSPARHTAAVSTGERSGHGMDTETEALEHNESREDSVIPQTPAKKKLRFAEEPSSSPLSSPPSSESTPARDTALGQLVCSSASKCSSAAAATEQATIRPETPRGKMTRTEIPSSSQLSTPLSSNRLALYGSVSRLRPTPSKGSSQVTEQDQMTEFPGRPGRRKLVIEDSFATTSSTLLSQLKRTPLKDVTTSVVPLKEVSEEEEIGSPCPKVPSEEESSSSIPGAMTTPSKRPVRRRRNGSQELGLDVKSPSPTKTPRSQPSAESTARAGKLDLSNITEIPDSEAEDDDFWGESEVETQERDFGKRAPELVPPKEPTLPVQEDRTPAEDMNTEEQQQETEEEATDDRETFVVGAETQSIFDEFAMTTDTSASEGDKLRMEDIQEEESMAPSTAVASSSSSRVKAHSNQSIPATHLSPTLPSLPAIRDFAAIPKPPPIRKPICQPVLPSSPTQFIESQRVPLAVIQSLGGVSSQTDAFLNTPPSQLQDLVSGHRVELSLPFRIPDCATRFWLFDGFVLQYMACVGAGVQDTNRWVYEVGQMYELNNPLDKESINDEGWYTNLPPRYAFLPPAIVSQLLSNLKHRLFYTDEDGIPTQGITQHLSSPVIHRQNLRSPPKKQGQPVAASRHLTTATTAAPSGSFSSASVSQQLEAQLRSETEQYTQHLQDVPASDDDILVPSTPIHERTPRPTTLVSPPPPPAFTPRPLPPRSSSSSQRRRNNTATTSTSKTPVQRHRQSAVQASQATTASQASSPENPSNTREYQTQQHSDPHLPPPPAPAPAPAPAPPHQPASSAPPSAGHIRPPPLPQSSSLVFHDISSSSPHGIDTVHSRSNNSNSNSNNSNSLANASVSQLLTKSQMLSDSLLQDDACVPALEMWDSDEEA